MVLEKKLSRLLKPIRQNGATAIPRTDRPMRCRRRGSWRSHGARARCPRFTSGNINYRTQTDVLTRRICRLRSKGRNPLLLSERASRSQQPQGTSKLMTRVRFPSPAPHSPTNGCGRPDKTGTSVLVQRHFAPPFAVRTGRAGCQVPPARRFLTLSATCFRLAYVGKAPAASVNPSCRNE
jgi:hypothetical protein